MDSIPFSFLSFQHIQSPLLVLGGRNSRWLWLCHGFLPRSSITSGCQWCSQSHLLFPPYASEKLRASHTKTSILEFLMDDHFNVDIMKCAMQQAQGSLLVYFHFCLGPIHYIGPSLHPTTFFPKNFPFERLLYTRMLVPALCCECHILKKSSVNEYQLALLWKVDTGIEKVLFQLC